MLRFILRRRAHGEALFAKMICNYGVHTIGVDSVDALGRVYQTFITESIIRQARLSHRHGAADFHAKTRSIRSHELALT